MGIPTHTTNVSIWCKQYFPQLLKGNKEYTYHSSWILMRRISNLTSQGEFKLNVAAGMTYSSLRESRSRLYENHVGVTTVRGPGWNDPMTAVVPRVKGFACYGLSFSRHNKNIKMEHFFLYILSRYFI